MDIPLIEVNHTNGHIMALFAQEENETTKVPEFPFLCLAVSGGHTQIIKVNDYFDLEIIGKTIDDAAGEAFDKVARVLGLKYPGGPNIEKCALDGKPVVPMPKMLKGGGGYNFSYSGLKTAVINYCHTKEQKGEEYSKADVACSFQKAAVDVLVEKTVEAALEKKVDFVTAGGGVAANTYLRESLHAACEKHNLTLILPEKRYCTDNAAMIASEGLVQYRLGNFADMTLTAKASIPLEATLQTVQSRNAKKEG
jgi:N6-L-threonylcarbamoyladenine synthase